MNPDPLTITEDDPELPLRADRKSQSDWHEIEHLHADSSECKDAHCILRPASASTAGTAGQFVVTATGDLVIRIPGGPGAGDADSGPPSPTVRAGWLVVAAILAFAAGVAVGRLAG